MKQAAQGFPKDFYGAARLPLIRQKALFWKAVKAGV